MTVPFPTNKKAIPVTLLSGFLGSGKTTLLENILKNEHGFKIAVIINDISSYNVDAELVSHHKVITTKEKIIKFQNGCICCTLRGDLLEELINIFKMDNFDYVIIESTGIGEPMQVAETFTQEFSELMLQNLAENNEPSSENTKSYEIFKQIIDLGGLNNIVRLDTCVTVVDAVNFSEDIETTDYLADRWGSKNNSMNEEDRTVTDLLVDQIEFADVIIINKSTEVSKRVLKKVKKIIHMLNPVAKIICTSYSNVSNKQVLDTNLFTFTKAVTSSGWLRSLENSNAMLGYGDNLAKKRISPKPETEEYGINNFVYRARKPFHPKRLYDLICDKFQIIERVNFAEADSQHGEESELDLESEEEEGEEIGSVSELTKEEIVKNKTNSPLSNIVRSKGFFWLATRYILRGEWSSAGSMLTLNAGSPWFGAMSKDFWPTDKSTIMSIEMDFQGVHEDRRQEIVFIGFKLNADKIQKAFDDCLLTDEEFAEYNKHASQKDLVKVEKKLNTLYEDGFEEWDFVLENL